MPTLNASFERARASPAASERAGMRSTSKRRAKRLAGSRRRSRRAAANISLAESLGATVVRVTADRPADGLIAFAKREGITHVIFGQSARTRWRSCGRIDAERFLEEVRDAAVQVVPLGEKSA
jgi:K+-sensing histidine kinase KdpD